ncbi:rhodanese-like domain-containing protein [Bacillus cereus]|uniref:rhodanese-like domain-containing protein n=1 Tax=Bacillus cereus TaxID=1396 RepID=UPI001F15962F|nr:rhodanese-like domain-containing protein [Bacillus cereus]BCC56591.1 hypothetical protein BCJMU07_p273 [Bacillus cereus]BCD32856.1 hypothetical protein BC30102_p271 [Bacillus cereus]HDR8469084.1 rhodanese-like domain-containing protein [Bacillus cereus]
MGDNNFFEEKVANTFSPMDYLNAKKSSPDKYFLIDVRNGPAHLREVKIKGAMEIPQNDLQDRLSEIPKDKEIILYCWDVWCNTAAKSAVTLIEQGYKVKELAGGIAAWKTMNFPLEKIVSDIPHDNACNC